MLSSCKPFFEESRFSMQVLLLQVLVVYVERLLKMKRHKYLYVPGTSNCTIFYLALCGRSNYCVLPSMRPVLAFWHWAHVEGYIGGILDCPS